MRHKGTTDHIPPMHLTNDVMLVCLRSHHAYIIIQNYLIELTSRNVKGHQIIRETNLKQKANTLNSQEWEDHPYRQAKNNSVL